MYIDTSELCDIYADQVDVVEPIFSSFGGVCRRNAEEVTEFVVDPSLCLRHRNR